ncbi:MAG: hypothetical protein M0Z67_04215 [Nitrospiraceae bacterium]|nr:hypothetical protein [Nitrospiraceae bacterium]
MRHFLLSGFLVLLLSGLAYAGTVVMDDAVNHEMTALTTDRVLKDSCEQLMDCRYGTKQLTASTMFTSAKGKKDYATMTSSTLDTTNMHALYSNTATTATSADSAINAVWATTADTASPTVTAFTANVINDTTIVGSAIAADTASKLGYASAATNPSMQALYTMYVEGAPYAPGTYPNGYISQDFNQRIYAQRPTTASTVTSGGTLGWNGNPPLESLYVREANDYSNSGQIQPWAGSTQGIADANGCACGQTMPNCTYTPGQTVGCGALMFDGRSY